MEELREKAQLFCAEHPEVLVAAGIALVVLDLVSLYKAVALLHEGRMLVGLKQLARSEALGG